MIYDEVRFSPAGDRHVLISLGDDATIDVNFLTQALAKELASLGEIITDSIPSYNSILVQYDFGKCGYADLCRLVGELHSRLPSMSSLEIASRIVTIPVYYMDPWTKACIEDYQQRIAQREYDPAFVARVNGLEGADDVVRRHSGTLHWVVTVSSFPGLPLLRPLDPACSLVCPKYNPPRTWTPVGSIGVGGTSTSIYTIPSPGGYNLIGRTPVPVWDPAQRLQAFRESAILLRSADRVKFRPIEAEEYRLIDAAVADGTYVYDIQPGVFAVHEYRDSLEPGGS